MPVNPETIDPQRQVSLRCLDSSSFAWCCRDGFVAGTPADIKESHSCVPVSTVVCLSFPGSSAEAARDRHWKTGDPADVCQESIGGSRTCGTFQG